MKSGYDEFWGNRGGGVDYFHHGIVPNVTYLWDGDVRIDEAGYYTDMLADRSLEFLDARAQKPDTPWLLSLHFTAPHWPWEGPGDQAESKWLANLEEPLGGLAVAHYDGGDMETYAEMVTSMDANIGRILTRLAQLGMEEDTVITITSDNGGERFSHNWPFTGIKTELLEGGILINRMPEKFAELKAAHDAWNAKMLSDPNAASFGWGPQYLADHYGWDD